MTWWFCTEDGIDGYLIYASSAAAVRGMLDCAPETRIYEVSEALALIIRDNGYRAPEAHRTGFQAVAAQPEAAR